MMKTKGLVVMLALVLAAAATAGVLSYVRGVERDARSTADLVTVIVAKKDIPAGTQMDQVIAQGGLTTLSARRDNLIRGVVTSLAQIRGKESALPILAGEQISTVRLGNGTALAGGILGIQAGFQALSVQLDASRVVGGIITRGDYVAIYGTFKGSPSESTATIVPSALVLSTATTMPPGEQNRRIASSSSTSLLVTLALRPRDAQKVVLTEEAGSVWLGLLPPGAKGTPLPPLTTTQMAR